MRSVAPRWRAANAAAAAAMATRRGLSLKSTRNARARSAGSCSAGGAHHKRKQVCDRDSKAPRIPTMIAANKLANRLNDCHLLTRRDCSSTWALRENTPIWRRDVVLSARLWLVVFVGRSAGVGCPANHLFIGGWFALERARSGAAVWLSVKKVVCLLVAIIKSAKFSQ